MISRAAQRNRHRWSGDDDRYTPPWLLERVERVLGANYLDPCPASFRSAPKINGLAMHWTGAVWVNPPYSSMAPWVTKALTEPVEKLLLLCPAYTDTAWFAPLFTCDLLCFIAGRVDFVAPDGRLVRAPHPSVLAYRGVSVDLCEQVFSDVGYCVRPLPRPSAGLGF